MKEENFKKGIEEIKNIRMNSAEKSAILNHILSTPIKSPYIKSGRMFSFVYSGYGRMAMIGCLALILSGSGVVFASGKSLPGDLFYPIKTNVVEPMIGVLKTTPLAKIEWETEKVIQRVAEAQDLASQNKLNTENTEVIESNINKSKDELISQIKLADSSTTPMRIKNAVENFKTNMQTRDDQKDSKNENEQNKNLKRLEKAANEALDKGMNEAQNRNNRGEKEKKNKD